MTCALAWPLGLLLGTEVQEARERRQAGDLEAPTQSTQPCSRRALRDFCGPWDELDLRADQSFPRGQGGVKPGKEGSQAPPVVR